MGEHPFPAYRSTTITLANDSGQAIEKAEHGPSSKISKSFGDALYTVECGLENAVPGFCAEAKA
jgi:hypothetical protein